MNMFSKFLDPKNDIAFKKIFGTENNKDILIHFLNDMLKFKEKKPITKVTFLKPIQDPEIASKKTSIVDIMCSDQLGNQYIVEMQVAQGDSFIKRAQYYAAKAYSSQLNVGGKYHTLKEIIFLAITNFEMFPDKTEYKSDHIILDKLSYEHDLKDFSFTFVDLTKFNKTKEELNGIVDRWCYFFKHAEETKEKDLNKIIGQEHIIQRAYEELNQFSWSQEELLAYDAVIKRERDNEAVLSFQLTNRYNEGKAEGKAEGIAEGEAKGRAEGIAEGEAKGKAEGIAEGEAKGRAEGKAEGITETVINMLNDNLSIDIISKYTGLSIEEIKNLQKEIKNEQKIY